MIMKQCAILNMTGFDEFAVYDKMLDKPMADCGWQTTHLPWNTPGVNWTEFDAVIIRSTWDYQDNANAFMKVLETIEKSGTALLNSLAIAQWNINKNYLKEVEAKGAKVIPTLWLEQFDFSLVEGYYDHFNTQQIVIKPTISANSDNTFWLKKESFESEKALLNRSIKGRQLMVQPFIPAIVEEGEYSLFYFAGQYSHCILKTPKKGDFRVQEEHGGLLRSIDPDEELLTAAKKALRTIPEKVLYARIDLVKFQEQFIEPSLYFNLDKNAASNFSKAFAKWMNEN